MYSFLTSCVSASNGDDINDMANMAEDIENTKFLELAEELGFKEWILENLGYDEWASKENKTAEELLLDDWGVEFYQSRFQGIPTLYLRHSGIEHIFIPNNTFNQYLSTEEESEERIELMEELSDKNEDLFYQGSRNPNYKKDIENFIQKNMKLLENNNISLVTMHLMFNQRDKVFIDYLKEKENTYLFENVKINNEVENFLNEKLEKRQEQSIIKKQVRRPL